MVALGRAELDVTDARAVARAVAEARPDVVVNCAAYARVDQAEAEPAEALRVNRDGARNLARAAAAAGARIVHFSTDYVFDGRERTPYAPDHPRNPLTAYARSKVEGEDAVVEAAPDALVVRVSWLFGGEGKGLVEHVLAGARAGRTLRLVRDQRSRPSWTANVVTNVVDLLSRQAPAGVWHVTDGGEATRLEQASEVLAAAGLDADIVEIGRTEFWPDVPRPEYSVLDVSATESFLGREMEPWRVALRRYLDERKRDAPVHGRR
jgi:dTDP-4-dehydrorhamnose reductase